jgi:fimbrial chaperone protein
MVGFERSGLPTPKIKEFRCASASRRGLWNRRGKKYGLRQTTTGLCFPRQLNLDPGASQAVRVQYTGPAGIETERAYRIIAEQLPIDFSGGNRTSGINVLFRYEGSIYVRPEGAEPDLVLVEASRQFEEGAFQGVRVEFQNRGTAHVIMDNMTLRLTLTDPSGTEIASEVRTEEQLPVIGGTNILAGATLTEIVQLPEEWAQGILDVQYDVDLVE